MVSGIDNLIPKERSREGGDVVQKEIIGVKEVMEIYGIPRRTAVMYLMQSKLVLPRVKNQKIRVHRKAFDEWLSSREEDR